MLKLTVNKNMHYDRRVRWTCPNCETVSAFIQLIPKKCDNCGNKLPHLLKVLKEQTERITYHFSKGIRRD